MNGFLQSWISAIAGMTLWRNNSRKLDVAISHPREGGNPVKQLSLKD